jgi:hypothetical protein
MDSSTRARSVPNYCSEKWPGIRKGIDGSQDSSAMQVPDEKAENSKTIELASYR